MNKKIKLLVENLFDDLYDIDQENDLTVDIADDGYIKDVINKFKNENNKTQYSDFSKDKLLNIEPYLKLAEDIFNFVKCHEKGNEKYYVYKVELYNESYKISIIYDTGTVAINMYEFYMQDETHIKLLNYSGNKFLELYGKDFRINIMDLLCLLNKKQIIVNEINYILSGHQCNIKNISFGRYVYNNDSQIITDYTLNNFPSIFIILNNTEKINVFNIKGLRVYISGLTFDSKEVCKKFYNFLKSKNIKKYNCNSYSYIKLQGDEYGTSVNSHEAINIQTEFCIANKLEQYSLTSDKNRIINLIEDEMLLYCKKHKDYDSLGYMWSYEFKDKGKDEDGSYVQILVDVEFDDRNGKHQHVKLLYDFYKTGLIKFEKDMTPASFIFYK